MRGVTLVFSRSPEQEAALHELLLAQRDPASSQFHRWITPEEFAARFGVADADLATVRAWLQSYGFSIDGVARGHNRISFSGTAGQIAAAFGSALHRYRSGDSVHFAPGSELHLPSALVPLVATIERLTDYRPAPPFHPVATPQFTASTTQLHLLDPLDLATQYNLSPVTKNYNGSGQAIAVVGQSWMAPADLGALHAILLQGSGGNFTEVLVPGTGVAAAIAGDEAEADIDVEYSSSIALGASIYLVYVGDSDNANVFTALSYAVSEDIAPIVSVSYGGCEADFSASDLSSIAQISEQATAQGQTIVASAGDQGFDACYGQTSLSTAQQDAASVDVPADLPDVTGVGGLQLAAGTFGPSDTQYLAPSTGQDLYNSLLSYVPEVVWNEDSTEFGLAAGGGGVSSLIQRPSWQTGVPGIPAGAFRLVPDVALQGSIQSPGFLYCTNDASAFSPGQTSSCSAPGEGDELTNTYSVAGGTSFGAPVLAGMLAVLNQATNNASGQGNINPILYSLASNSVSYGSAFHDITSGSTACTTGVAVCAAVGQAGAPATPGYDEASGLGSIDFANLVSLWPTPPIAGLFETSVNVLPASYTPAAGSAQQVTIDLYEQTPYTAVATGAVRVLLDGQVIAAAAPLTPTNLFVSAATASYTAPSSPGGHVLSVVYAGDSQHSSSSGSNVITVGSTEAAGSFSLSAGSINLSKNSSTSTKISVTPEAGYTGVVNLSLTNLTTNSSSATLIELCYGSDQISTYSGPGSGILFVGEGAACDATAAASTKMRRLRLRPLSKEQADARSKSDKGGLGTAALAAMLFVVILPFGRRCRRLPVLVATLCFLLASFGLVGCGSSSGSTGTSPPPPPTAVVITATLSGSDSVNGVITASTTFSITFTQ